jgi:hypothetical protein
MSEAEVAVAAWNAAHATGTPVRYWKGRRGGKGRVSSTRSDASCMGGHTAVVWVVGEAACIALSHVEPIE